MFMRRLSVFYRKKDSVLFHGHIGTFRSYFNIFLRILKLISYDQFNGCVTQGRGLMNNFTMVIPSYWGRAGEDVTADEKIVFDHPTPLDEEGTLGRLLESMEVLHGVSGAKIVIIAVSNHPEITFEASERVRSIISPYTSRYDIKCLHLHNLEKVCAELAQRGVSAASLKLLNFDNYAAVRNVCSLAGVLNGSSYTVFIDDDEVFTDPHFLQKVDEGIGRSLNGDFVHALAGYYLQPDTYLLDESRVPEWRVPYWNNARAMNSAFELFIGRGKRLKPIPFVFGGNMAVSLPVLKRVPFDPRITRGEDIDFLLNLRIQGIVFYLDRELAIRHLPPEYSSRPAWKKVREDALRFLYDRKKVRDHPVLSLEELMPYPGEFLGPDLDERIVKTSELLLKEYQSKGQSEDVRECEKNISIAREDPYRAFDIKTWLGQITEKWREITARAEGCGIPE